MPWHSPTGAAGGRPEAAACARLTAPSGHSARVARWGDATPVIATGQIDIGVEKEKKGESYPCWQQHTQKQFKNKFLKCGGWKVWVSNVIIPEGS